MQDSAAEDPCPAEAGKAIGRIVAPLVDSALERSIKQGGRSEDSEFRVPSSAPRSGFAKLGGRISVRNAPAAG